MEAVSGTQHSWMLRIYVGTMVWLFLMELQPSGVGLPSAGSCVDRVEEQGGVRIGGVERGSEANLHGV